MTVAVITSMTAYLYLYSHGMVSHAASQPVSAISLSTLSSPAWLEHYMGLIWISWSRVNYMLFSRLSLSTYQAVYNVSYLSSSTVVSWIYFVKCFRVRVLLRSTPQCMFYGENVSVGNIQGVGFPEMHSPFRSQFFIITVQYLQNWTDFLSLVNVVHSVHSYMYWPHAGNKWSLIDPVLSSLKSAPPCAVLHWDRKTDHTYQLDNSNVGFEWTPFHFFFSLMYVYGMEKWAIHGYNSSELKIANPFVPFLAHMVSTDSVEELAVGTFLSAKYHGTIWFLHRSLSSILSSMEILLCLLNLFLEQVLLYLMVPLVLGLPLDMFYMQTRFFFLRTLVRLTFPIQVCALSMYYDEQTRWSDCLQVEYHWVILQIIYRIVWRIQDALYEEYINWLQIRQNKERAAFEGIAETSGVHGDSGISTCALNACSIL